MTQPEIDDLLRKLLEKAGGAHIHTANKAGCYLMRFSQQGDEPRLSSLTFHINNAIQFGDWAMLKLYMRRWW